MSSVDRLNELPDSVLCHILSFLPTKRSVETSILTRRWRFLWTGVSSLDLDSDEYDRKSKDGKCFSDIIDIIISLHNVQAMTTFRLSLSPNYTQDEIINCRLEKRVATVIVCKVQTLRLCLETSLPRCLFTCKTLVDLSLFCCVFNPLDGDICFPCLKKLDLYYVRFKIDESLPRLISGCPVLEESDIHEIFSRDFVCCNVSSPTIKSLSIHSEPCGFYSHDYRVEINSPGLTFLNLYDCRSEHISTQNLTSLNEAYIGLQNDMEKEDGVVYSRSVLEFVDRLCNVEPVIVYGSF